ncbi:MAG: hypothetical protein JXA44_13045 [Methanospirillaceae archaeon]|nr:hypothetical protein [Methanospirillaceae archaeon]
MIVPGKEGRSIEKIALDINRYLSDAQQIHAIPSRKGMTKDRRDWYAECMVTFALINRALDLGFFILDIYGYTDPDGPVRYKAMIKRLHDHDLIDDKTREGMIALIDYRNRISHHFQTITSRDAWAVSDVTGIVKTYTDAMQQAYEHRSRYQVSPRVLLAAGIIGIISVIFIWFIWA